MPRHTRHLALRPVDPAQAPPTFDDVDLDEPPVNVKVACEMLGGVSERTCYRLMDSGKLAYIQDGPGCLRWVPRSEIRRYLAARLKHGGRGSLWATGSQGKR